MDRYHYMDGCFASTYVCVLHVAQGGQKRALESLELQLQLWVLRNELSLQEQCALLSAEPCLPHPQLFFQV